MDITIKSETTVKIEANAFLKDGAFKTHDCDPGQWWGEDICKTVDFSREISKLNLPNGEYKVLITFEKV